MSAKRAVQAAKKERAWKLQVPEHLRTAIKEGNCVAFVGAGFSGAARLPGWGALLTAILERGKAEEKLGDKIAKDIEKLIEQATASSFDRAAQIMEDKCGGLMVAEVVKEMLAPPGDIPEAMKERLKLIHSIPFSAILTTNFDSFLPGVPAASSKSKVLMRKILRGSPLTLSEQVMREVMMAQSVKESLGTDLFGFDEDEDDTDEEDSDPDKLGDTNLSMKKRWEQMEEAILERGNGSDSEEEGGGRDDSDCDSEDEYDPADDIGTTPIIQLHGSVADDEWLNDPGLAFTREGYRKLLHGNESYTKFMTSLMAAKTILYMGFSFSDEYLNEMRSSVMMMMQQHKDPDDDEEGGKKEAPIAYGIGINMADSEIEFYREHEGIQMLNYIPTDGGPGFEGIEKWLEALLHATNPLLRLGKVFKGKHILVCGRNKLCGIFGAFAAIAKKKYKIDIGTIRFGPPPDEGEDFEEGAINQLLASVMEKQPLHLVIVDHGRHEQVPQVAQSFLDAMNLCPRIRAPLLVCDTTRDKYHVKHKRAVLRKGAGGYANSIQTLFSEVHRMLDTSAVEQSTFEKACMTQ